MNNLIEWLPTKRTCGCPDGKLNCLTRQELCQHGSTILNVETRHVWKEKHPARFVPELPERYIHLFSHCGETVLDPFCGSGTTNVVASQLGRNSVGIDINPFSVDMASRRVRAEGVAGTKHTIQVGDSQRLDTIPDGSIDLIVTSPPYFDMADYRCSDEAQLGNRHDYQAFLEGMYRCFDSMHRVLKPGGYCIVNTQDVYKSKVKCPMHIDYANHMTTHGWELININIYILNFSTGGRLVFGYPKAYYPKNDHEFILIMRKPTE